MKAIKYFFSKKNPQIAGGCIIAFYFLIRILLSI
jgi:hypothetical protein